MPSSLLANCNPLLNNLIIYRFLRVNKSIIAQTFLKLDYHGARVKIFKSNCPSLIKLSGTIIKETHGTFTIFVSGGKIVGTDLDFKLFCTFFRCPEARLEFINHPGVKWFSIKRNSTYR